MLAFKNNPFWLVMDGDYGYVTMYFAYIGIRNLLWVSRPFRLPDWTREILFVKDRCCCHGLPLEMCNASI